RALALGGAEFMPHKRTIRFWKCKLCGRMARGIEKIAAQLIELGGCRSRERERPDVDGPTIRSLALPAHPPFWSGRKNRAGRWPRKEWSFIDRISFAVRKTTSAQRGADRRSSFRSSPLPGASTRIRKEVRQAEKSDIAHLSDACQTNVRWPCIS